MVGRKIVVQYEKASGVITEMRFVAPTAPLPDEAREGYDWVEVPENLAEQVRRRSDVYLVDPATKTIKCHIIGWESARRVR